MINIIIPGFASSKQIFEPFLKLFPDTIFIPLEDHFYITVKKQLDQLTSHGEKLHIFGWSLGSIFALKWTLANQDKVKSLFLTGSTASFCEKPYYQNGTSIKKIEQMQKLIKRKTRAVLYDFYQTIFEYVENKQRIIDLLMKQVPPLPFLLNGLSELINTDLVNQLNKLKIPVHLLHGKYDKTTPMTGAILLNRLLSNSRLLSYDGGHAVFLENPVYCSNAWKDFLCTVN